MEAPAQPPHVGRHAASTAAAGRATLLLGGGGLAAATASSCGACGRGFVQPFLPESRAFFPHTPVASTRLRQRLHASTGASRRHHHATATAVASTPASRSSATAAASVAVGPLLFAGLLGLSSSRRRHQPEASGRKTALAARRKDKAAELLALGKGKTKTQMAEIVESALVTFIEENDPEPDIFKIRELMARLTKYQDRQNRALAGDWIMLWASRPDAVAKVWCSGITDSIWQLELEEYLIRFGTRKAGRLISAREVLRKIGPFPNRSVTLLGYYKIGGSTELQIIFDDYTMDVEEPDAKMFNGRKKKVSDLNVIYSSPRLIACQWQGPDGECDFFVFTPIEDIDRMNNKLLGAERKRFFWN